jgi:hypothetical protein
MDEVTIQKIATEVARHLAGTAWMLLLVQAVLLAAAAAAGAFFGEYLKTRGKNLATKADFDSLQNQLRANTELVETIKAEVGQKDWTQRERTSLRRIKLEVLIEKMQECETYLDQHRSRFMEGKGTDDQQRDLLNELSAMGVLYFPELQEEVTRFYIIGKQQITMGLKLAQALGSDDMAVRQSALDTFGREWTESYKELIAARSALTDAARRLLVEIMGEDERP